MEIHSGDWNALSLANKWLISLLEADDKATAWPKGPPRNSFRSHHYSLNEYIDCITAVEGGPVGREGLPGLARRMRRLAFSFFTEYQKRLTSTMFDVMINSNLSNPLWDPPLTTDHVDEAKLNLLFDTSNIITPNDSRVGISHAWAGIDLALNGLNLTGLAGELVLNTPILSLATWLGDLATAVGIYENKLKQGSYTPIDRRQIMAECLRSKCSKGEMLGNLDAFAIGNYFAIKANEITASSFLREYYTNDNLDMDQAATLGKPCASYRFHYFLKNVKPTLPSVEIDSELFFSMTFDKTEARRRMQEILSTAIDDFHTFVRFSFSLGSKGIDYFISDDPEPASMRVPIVERLDLIGALDGFHWLCDEFCRFIEEGILHGDAEWPPVP